MDNIENIENKKPKKDILGEIFRFLLIGTFSTLIDYSVFFIFNGIVLKEINGVINLLISTFLGFVSGVTINWLFSAKFVYQYEKKTTKKQLLMYIVLCVVGLSLTMIVMQLAKPLFETSYMTIVYSKDAIVKELFEFDIWKWFFKILMTFIVLVLNYLGRKFLIFKD